MVFAPPRFDAAGHENVKVFSRPSAEAEAAGAEA